MSKWRVDTAVKRGSEASGSSWQAVGILTSTAAAHLTAPEKRLLSFTDESAVAGILYQHSTLCQMSMPYRDPGNEARRWVRKNGYLTLELEAGRAFDERVGGFCDVGLPFGPKPRLVLAHLNAEAVRTQEPRIELERSLSGFVRRTLSLDPHGRNLQTIREQLTRLAAADFRIGRSAGNHSQTVQGRILNGFSLWTPAGQSLRVRWPTEVQFSLEYFESLLSHAVPLNESAMVRLSHNAMALDIYTWLAQRLHRIEPGRPACIAWGSLKEQFGPGYAEVREFRRVFKNTLKQVRVVYPDAHIDAQADGLKLEHSRPPVAKRLVVVGGGHL
jgi:Plasmid encoded RepA protein